jgi:hypothetical protein
VTGTDEQALADAMREWPQRVVDAGVKTKEGRAHRPKARNVSLLRYLDDPDRLVVEMRSILDGPGWDDPDTSGSGRRPLTADGWAIHRPRPQGDAPRAGGGAHPQAQLHRLEHLLLGVLREEEGLAAHVLESFDITVERVRNRVVRIVGSGEEETTEEIPFTPRAKKAIDLAQREALSLG